MSRLTLAVAVAAALPTSLASQTVQWVDKAAIQGRAYARLAYDTVRGRAVLFGGTDDASFGVRNETWESDGTRWVRREPAIQPSYAINSAMAYDGAREHVVLLQPTRGETWVWNGVEWVQRFPAIIPPGTVGGDAGMTYSAAAERVQVTVNQGELWEWGGSDWTHRTTAPTTASSAIVYDPGRGSTLAVNAFGETWAWNGASWTLLATTGPSLNSSDNLVYDAARGRVVAVRTRFVYSYPITSTWEWNGSAWTLSPDRSLPNHAGQAMWYDAVHGRVLLFGGIYPGSEPAPPARTLRAWDGTTWQIVPRDEPGAVHDHAMAYDESRRRVVLHGRTGTFEWNGGSWTSFSTTPGPAAVSEHAMAYDGNRQRVILFGGTSTAGQDLDETWEWDGTAWNELFPSARPSNSGVLAYDSARRRTVFFGGGETWEWDGADWLPQTPATTPPARTATAMAYDAGRQWVVLFGGLSTQYVRLRDTWEWNGVDWVERLPTTRPPNRSGHAMAYDASRGRVVMAGGQRSFLTFTGESWEWDGTNWAPLPAAPEARAFVAMAYDATAQNVVLHGGAIPDIYQVRLSRDGSWVVGHTQDAGASVYGPGCAGLRGPLRFGAFGRPSFANASFALELQRLAGAAPSVLLLSSAQASLPLGGGCDLLVAPPIAVVSPALTSPGYARFPLLIPVIPGLRGGSVFAQAAAIDPLGPYLGLAFSRGVQLVLGE